MSFAPGPNNENICDLYKSNIKIKFAENKTTNRGVAYP
jgi:hypothetical protein